MSSYEIRCFECDLCHYKVETDGEYPDVWRQISISDSMTPKDICYRCYDLLLKAKEGEEIKDGEEKL